MLRRAGVAGKECARCGNELRSYSTSYFNRDLCCLSCLDDEKTAPGYAAAVERESKEVAAGNYNYEGVGLSREDIAHLIGKLAERKEGQ